MTRLPIPGSDDGTWGSILNDFLDVEHNSDGSLKNVVRPTQLDDKLDHSLLTTKGDLLVAGSSAVPTRLGVGSNGTVLTADSTQTTGMKWAAIPGGSGSTYPNGDTATVVGRPEVFDVTDYGAVGDGSTDDTTAIQNALNAAAASSRYVGGGTVQLGAKTYVVGPLTIPHRVTLQGIGRNASILQMRAGSIAPCLTFGAHTQVSTIRDLRIDGNKYNQTSTGAIGILFQTPFANGSSDEFNDPRNVVQNVMVQSCKGDGIQMSGRGGHVLTNIAIWACDGNGILADGQDSFFSDIDIGGCGLDGFLVTGAEHHFANCKAWYSGGITNTGGVGNGWHINTFGGFTGTSLSAQDNGRAGFYFDSCGRVSISGLIADSNNYAGHGDPGVDLSNAYAVTLDGVSWDRSANTNRQQYALRIGGGSGGNSIRLTTDNNAIGWIDPASVTDGNEIFFDSTRGTQSVSYSSSLTPVPYYGGTIRVTLTGNITINAVDDPYSGLTMRFIFTQDATGGRTVTWNAVYKTTWTPNTAANKTNIIEFMYNGSNWLQLNTTVGL